MLPLTSRTLTDIPAIVKLKLTFCADWRIKFTRTACLTGSRPGLTPATGLPRGAYGRLRSVRSKVQLERDIVYRTYVCVFTDGTPSIPTLGVYRA